MTLRERLLKALEVAPAYAHPCASTCSGWRQGVERGAFEEARRTQKIDLALADVVEALEDLKNDIECRGDAYWLVCRTIAKLDEALKGLGK